MAIFLAIGGLLFSFAFLPKTGVVEEKGIFGGPSLLVHAEGAEIDSAAALKVADSPFLTSDTQSSELYAASAPDSSSFYIDGALKDPGEAIGPSFSRSGTVAYIVERGDTLSRIASYFGISVDTIINANPGVRSGSIKAGQRLTILPTSGVVYQSLSGDTLASIASSFGVSQDKIRQFNNSVHFDELDPGTPIIIPGGKNIKLASQNSGLPNFDNDFIMPAQGYNWGILHHYNAVDIANSCGTPVIASAEGLVVPDDSIPDATDGWNAGYGNFILIEHPFGNNVETRYAHLEKMLVQPGDYVKQGQEIGLMGETGDATGCHVHFEVIGAHNPFAKS